MAHTYVSNLVHCIFSTRERRKTITGELQERLWPYVAGIARKNDIPALAIGGMPDHLHALLSVPATMPLAKAVQLIKGGSSKWVHETFPQQRFFEWQ
jgi:REP element-mobilizing transposase RayT